MRTTVRQFSAPRNALLCCSKQAHPGSRKQIEGGWQVRRPTTTRLVWTAHRGKKRWPTSVQGRLTAQCRCLWILLWYASTNSTKFRPLWGRLQTFHEKRAPLYKAQKQHDRIGLYPLFEFAQKVEGAGVFSCTVRFFHKVRIRTPCRGRCSGSWLACLPVLHFALLGKPQIPCASLVDCP